MADNDDKTILDDVLDNKRDDKLDEKDVVAVPVPLNLMEDEFPDGGFQGWLTVFGAACLTFSTFGLVNTWGVFQEYYTTSSSPDLSNVSPSTISWIGSVQYALVFLPGLVSGRLFDIGHFHPPLIASTCVLIVAVFLVAECHTFWQLILCQGIALGVASGFIFGPALAVVSHYFKARRSTAFGVVATGSSVGGTVLPIAVRKLLPIVGFPWTMRIIGFILLAVTGVANIILRRRLPPTKVAGGLFNLKAFRSAPYSLYVAASAIAFLGMYTVLTYIDTAAVAAGIDPDFSFYLVSICNAASLFGRLSSGFLSDAWGPLNILIPFSLVAAATTYAWPYCTSVGSIVAIALIYGFASGAFVGLLASPVTHLGGTGDVGRRTGMMFTICSAGALVGPPISGAIHDAKGGFHEVGAYAGTMIVLSCLFMGASRWMALGGLWGHF